MLFISPTRAFETTLEALATTTTVGGVEYVASSAQPGASPVLAACVGVALSAAAVAAGFGLGL